MQLEWHAEDPFEQLLLATETPQLEVDVITGVYEEPDVGTVELHVDAVALDQLDAFQVTSAAKTA